MNKTISIDEIMSLYKQCNVVLNDNQNIRTDINKGTLHNKLNSTFNNLSLSNTPTVTFSDTSVATNGSTRL